MDTVFFAQLTTHKPVSISPSATAQDPVTRSVYRSCTDHICSRFGVFRREPCLTLCAWLSVEQRLTRYIRHLALICNMAGVYQHPAFTHTRGEMSFCFKPNSAQAESGIEDTSRTGFSLSASLWASDISSAQEQTPCKSSGRKACLSRLRWKEVN